MALRFGVQESSPQGNPELDADVLAGIEELVQLGLANGHVTQVQVGELRQALLSAARTGNVAYLDRVADAYAEPVAATPEDPRNRGDIPLLSGIMELGTSGRLFDEPTSAGAGILPENALGIEGAYTTIGPNGKVYVLDKEGKIIDEVAAGAADGGANTPTQRDLDVLLKSGVISKAEYDQAQRERFLGKGSAGGGYASQDLRDLEEAAKRAEAVGDTELAAQYRARAQAILLGDSKAAMSPGESARLAEDIRQFDLSHGLQREKFGQEKLQTQIQAARTAQPLTYLSLLRGSPQQYAGLGQFAPTLAQGGEAAAAGGGIPNMSANPGGGYGVDMSGGAQGGGVPMPPSMQAINEAAPIKQGGLPGGEGAYLRFEGPQAQRNLTPFEMSANTEAREFQGIPEMDQQYQQALLRRGVGSGLRFGGYGGTLRG